MALAQEDLQQIGEYVKRHIGDWAVQRKASSRLWAVNTRSHQCSRVSASAVSIR